MRKLLMTSAAVILTLTEATALAFAQSAPSVLPPNVMEGVAAAPLPIQSANNANNTYALPQPNGVVNPTPGTVVVHLNGRVLFGGA